MPDLGQSKDVLLLLLLITIAAACVILGGEEEGGRGGDGGLGDVGTSVGVGSGGCITSIGKLLPSSPVNKK